jgi:uncharacterized protein YeaO (DUF488 family)
MSAINIKRAYDATAQSDGFRILVDRLWPRGIKKEDAHFDVWLKDIAPSNELRKWFNHETEKWKEFRKRYRTELKESGALQELLVFIKKHKIITFVYGAKDEQHNQAVVLKDFVQEK